MKDFFKIGLPILAIIFIGFFTTYVMTVKEPKQELTIATGRVEGAYYTYALEYKKLLKQEQITLNIVPTAGSIEALKLLREKKVDIAFTQGGTVNKNDKKNLEVLASLYNEPIWIFYKGDDLEYIYQFKGKSISVGETGSGVFPVALSLLQSNGITFKNSTLYKLSIKQSIQKLKSGEINILFTIASPYSTSVQEILQDKSIKIMNLRRAKAYAQAYLYSVLTLEEGMLDLEKNIPSIKVELLSKMAFLAVDKNLDGKLKRLIVRKAKIIHSQKGVFEKENEFPNQRNLELPISIDAKKYLENGDTFLEKIFPYHIAQTIDRFKLLIIPIITLLLPFIKGALPLFRWTIRRKIYKYYKSINRLDNSVLEASTEELKVNLIALQDLLKQIKKETNIPLSYMGEYYDLIIHIDIVIKHIETALKIKQNT